MGEICPFCQKEFANRMALGSHIHYVHEAENWTEMSKKRSANEKERFEKLLGSCLEDRGLPKPRQTDELEQVVTEIPEGVSDTIDQYREALRCAIRKEKFVKEFEEEFSKKASEEGNK